VKDVDIFVMVTIWAVGNKLWEQTELRVYHNSIHCIWGMMYKYSKLAMKIVFREKHHSCGKFR
jgi:hypothetical protein